MAVYSVSSNAIESIIHHIKTHHWNNLENVHIICPTTKAAYSLRIKLENTLLDKKAFVMPCIGAISHLEDIMHKVHINNPEDIKNLYKPSIDGDIRSLHLSSIIAVKKPNYSYRQILRASQDLGLLLDFLRTENIDINSLQDKVPTELSEHFIESISLLIDIDKEMNSILETYSSQNILERSSSIINAYTNYINNNPQVIVYVYGIHRHFKAANRILSTVAKRNNGYLFIQNYDHNHPEVQNKYHPHNQTYNFLQDNAIDPKDIIEDKRDPSLATLLMKVNHNQSYDLNKEDLDLIERHLTMINADNIYQETAYCALLMLEAQKSAKKPVVLVAEDQNYINMVRGALNSMGYEPDISEGSSLADLKSGEFFQVCLNMLINKGEDTDSLLSLLKHPLLHIEGHPSNELLDLANFIDLKMRKPSAKTGIYRALMALENLASPHNAIDLVQYINKSLIENHNTNSINNAIDGYINFVKDMSHFTEENNIFLSKLNNLSKNIQNFSLNNTGYPVHEALEALIHSILFKTFVPALNQTANKLKIVSTIEAQFIDSDLCIIGQVKEGTFPQYNNPSWLSKKMLNSIGAKELYTNYETQESFFVNVHNHSKVIWLRSAKGDININTLSRFAAPLVNALRNNSMLHIIEKKDVHDSLKDKYINLIDYNYKEPEPEDTAITLKNNIQFISPSDIQTWREAPYNLLLKKFAGIKELDSLYNPSNSLIGTIIHNLLQKHHDKLSIGSMRSFVDNVTTDFEKEIYLLSSDIEQNIIKSHAIQDIAKDVYKQYKDINPHSSESEKTISIELSESITLRGRIDRLDHTEDTLYITDYKTGKKPQDALQLSIFSYMLAQTQSTPVGGYEFLMLAKDQSALSNRVIFKDHTKNTDLQALELRAKDAIDNLFSIFNGPEIQINIAELKEATKPQGYHYKYIDRFTL